MSLYFADGIQRAIDIIQGVKEYCEKRGIEIDYLLTYHRDEEQCYEGFVAKLILGGRPSTLFITGSESDYVVVPSEDGTFPTCDHADYRDGVEFQDLHLAVTFTAGWLRDNQRR